MPIIHINGYEYLKILEKKEIDYREQIIIKP